MASSKHKGELGEFETVMQNRDAVQVCNSVENSPNFPQCSDEAMEARKKVLYCLYKIFLKDNSTNEGNK